MNQREFYERIYNYKHGIKEDNDTIQHSAKGDEWDSHKYKDKIYLGEGKYRYVYDDGTSSTGYKPLDVNDPVRQKQRSQQTANTAQGISQKLANDAQSVNGKKEAQEAQTSGTIGSSSYTPPEAPSKPIPYAQLAREQEQGKINEAKAIAAGTRSDALKIGSFLKDNVGTQSPSDPNFSQARKESYAAEGYDKAPKSAPIPYAKLDAQAKEGEKMAALYGGTGGQVKPNTGTLGSGVASDSAKQTTAPNFAQGLRTNLAQTTLSDSTNIGNKQQPNFNPAVGQSRSNEAIDIGNFLTQNVQNAKNWDAPSGAPYSELQVQSVKTTNNQLTPKAALDNYTSQLKDVYYELNSLGVPDDSIINLIRYAEQQALGTSIIDQLNTYDPKNDNVVFMDGAEQAFDEYSSKVIPALKAYASSLKNNESTSYAQAYANANPTHDVPVSNNSGNSSQVTVNDNVTTWDNVPTQTWENTPDPSYTYVVENGYDPEHISVEAAKELFGVTPKYDDVYEYRIGTNGMLYYKRKSWNE